MLSSEFTIIQFSFIYIVFLKIKMVISRGRNQSLNLQVSQEGTLLKSGLSVNKSK